MKTMIYGATVRYTVLGPVAVTADGAELPLGGPRQRLVLALLVAARGRVVPVGDLIDGVWGEDPPRTAKKALQGYVHHLRAQVGPAIRTEPDGYALDTAGELDAERFEALAATTETLLEADPASAASTARDALGLWVGTCYAGLSDSLGLTAEIAHLEGLRLRVLGDRFEADLALGRHMSLTGELEGVIEEYPLHDRFRMQLMLAYYRSGRQVEALRLFERTRQMLAEELGLEPPPGLVDLERRILAHDPALDASTADDQIDTVRGYELRELLGEHRSTAIYRGYQRSMGREVLISVLDASIADDVTFVANHLAVSDRVAAIDHPHIGHVFDTWREPGRAYQVSRWLSGGSLAQRLGDGPLQVSVASQTIGEIGSALAQAHRQGVSHGAVSADAVWFDESGHAYLRDFGVQPSDDADSMSADRQAFVSLAHEILTGVAPADLSTGGGSRVDRSKLDERVASVFEVALGPDGYRRLDDFVRALRQASGLDVVPLAAQPLERSEVRNPYKGLMAFQEADSADFFGREELTERLHDALETHRLVAVVGPSGAGKSSVVKAGLASALRARSETTLLAEMFPGAYPFEELEGALTRVGVHPVNIMAELLGDDRGLLRVLKQILPDGDEELVLVIDQFEELFSATASSETRRLFLDSIVHAVDDPRSRLRVVLTMRADFFDRPLEHARFGRMLEAGLVPVTVMDEQELAQAIAGPAAAVDVEFEAGLVPHIVREVTLQPGALPLLQFTLTELFDNRTTNEISLADYQASGGIVGALASRAEDTYLAMDDAQRAALRHALLRMVAADEDSDDLRLRVRRADLHADGVGPAALNDALNLFGASRLLTFDLDRTTRGPTVEVAHEALLREWPRLATWIDEQRDDLVIRRRLAVARAEWQDADQDQSYLPTGGRLAQFETWAAGSTLELAPGERQFLQEAVEHERRGEERSARRRKAALLLTSTAAVVLAAVAVFALIQQSNADAAAHDAETSRLAATAQNVSDTLTELGLLVAAESHNRAVTAETLGALQRVLMDASELSTAYQLGHGSSGISADGTLLSVWNTETETQGPLFDISGPTPIRIDPPTEPIETRHPNCAQFPTGCPGVLNSWVDFVPGGGDLLVQSVDGVLHLYREHDFDQPMLQVRNATQSFATSPDETLFAHGTFCATVEEFDNLTAPTCSWEGFNVVDLRTGEIVFSKPDDLFARGFSWSADGSKLHRVGGDGSVRVWDTASWVEIDFVGDEPAGVSSIDHPPAGDYVAITDHSGTITLLDSETGEVRNTIAGLIETEGLATAAFSNDGSLLLTVLRDVVRLWDPLTGEQIGVPIMNEANAPRSQSGAVIQLATEIGDEIHVWNLDTTSWFEMACEAAGRNMTRAEWDQFGPRDTPYRATCPQFGIEQ